MILHHFMFHLHLLQRGIFSFWNVSVEVFSLSQMEPHHRQIAPQLFQEFLMKIPDLERLVNRVRTNSANPRDLASIRTGLTVIPTLIAALPKELPPGGAVVGRLHSSTTVVELLESSISDDPSLIGKKGSKWQKLLGL